MRVFVREARRSSAGDTLRLKIELTPSSSAMAPVGEWKRVVCGRRQPDGSVHASIDLQEPQIVGERPRVGTRPGRGRRRVGGGTVAGRLRLRFGGGLRAGVWQRTVAAKP